MAMCSEGPATVFECTSERFFTVVNTHVCFQVALFREFLIAAFLRTYEGFEAAL